MPNTPLTRAFPWLAAAVALASTILGCVVTTNGQGAAKPTGESAADRANFPASMALLERADAALGAHQYDDAIALSRQVDAKVRDELARAEKTNANVESADRAHELAIVLEGLAQRGAGRDLEALLSLRDRRLHPARCGEAVLARCREHAEWLKTTYAGVVSADESISGQPETLALSLDSAAEPDGVLDARAMKATMTMTEREVRARKNYAGLLIEPISSKPGKSGVTLRVEGTGFTGTSKECGKVGEVRIGGTDFDVEKCHQQGYAVQGASFSATVVADDAKQITGAKGERVFIVFETKSWKSSGSAYAVTGARVAYVTTSGKH